MAFGEATATSIANGATNALARRIPGVRDGQENRNVADALSDLTLPEALATSLASLFAQLGYTLTRWEVRDRAGAGRRWLTLAACSESKDRHLVHIPSWILDDPNEPNPMLVSALGFMLPAGLRVFVLSEDLDSPADYWDELTPVWRQDSHIDATFVAWRRVTRDLALKAREDQLASLRTMFDLKPNGAQSPPTSSGGPAGRPPDEPPQPERPYVFISYSWDSDEHKRKVLQLADWLRTHGVEAWIDQWETSPAQGWPNWCEDQIERANFVLVVCTEAYRKRVRRKESPGPEGEPVGRGVTWEGAIITNEVYNSTAGQSKYIPIVFSGNDKKHVPSFLGGFSIYDLGNDGDLEGLYRAVTQQRRYVPPPIGSLVVPEELGPSPLGPAHR